MGLAGSPFEAVAAERGRAGRQHPLELRRSLNAVERAAAGEADWPPRGIPQGDVPVAPEPLPHRLDVVAAGGLEAPDARQFGDRRGDLIGTREQAGEIGVDELRLAQGLLADLLLAPPTQILGVVDLDPRGPAGAPSRGSAGSVSSGSCRSGHARSS